MRIQKKFTYILQAFTFYILVPGHSGYFFKPYNSTIVNQNALYLLPTNTIPLPNTQPTQQYNLKPIPEANKSKQFYTENIKQSEIDKLFEGMKNISDKQLTELSNANFYKFKNPIPLAPIERRLINNYLQKLKLYWILNQTNSYANCQKLFHKFSFLQTKDTLLENPFELKPFPIIYENKCQRNKNAILILMEKNHLSVKQILNFDIGICFKYSKDYFGC